MTTFLLFLFGSLGLLAEDLHSLSGSVLVDLLSLEGVLGSTNFLLFLEADCLGHALHLGLVLSLLELSGLLDLLGGH